jgi:hypothetical protein
MPTGFVTSTDSRILQEVQNDLSNPGAQQRVNAFIFARSENTRVNRLDSECRYTQKRICWHGFNKKSEIKTNHSSKQATRVRRCYLPLMGEQNATTYTCRTRNNVIVIVGHMSLGGFIKPIVWPSQ